MFRKFVDWLIQRAVATPYFHLHHGDGSIYMERYWLVPFPPSGSETESIKEGRRAATWREPLTWLLQKLGIAVRLHVIHTPDLDRHMHDHPWSFVSVVLRGFYQEARPIVDDPNRPGLFNLSGVEPQTWRLRKTGSVALRTVHDRHLIRSVSHGGVYTLFITGRKRQSWGFFTEKGWVNWRDYPSVHNTKPIS